MLLGITYEYYQLGLCLSPRNLSPYMCAQSLAVETEAFVHNSTQIRKGLGQDHCAIQGQEYQLGLLLSGD